MSQLVISKSSFSKIKSLDSNSELSEAQSKLENWGNCGILAPEDYESVLENGLFFGIFKLFEEEWVVESIWNSSGSSDA